MAVKAMQRFARAGWLNREAANSPALQPRQQLATQPGHHLHRRRAGFCAQADVQRGSDALTCAWSSPGRIGDVCAELDRLAALEQASMARAA